AERGTAAAIFNAAQYFATVLFAPLVGWLVHTFGWASVFYVMGGLGVLMSGVRLKTVHGPKEHPLVNAAELDYIAAGGALVFVGANALLTVLCYVFLVGEIKRFIFAAPALSRPRSLVLP
ncbi:MAG TPA: MFS transporter, partial [Janthinobacterium sp.]|nr:MFS transporter [Janthinobacterium sp.]